MGSFQEAPETNQAWMQKSLLPRWPRNRPSPAGDGPACAPGRLHPRGAAGRSRQLEPALEDMEPFLQRMPCVNPNWMVVALCEANACTAML